MRNELEAEKRKAEEAEAKCEAFRVMLDESRKGYALLYHGCQIVLTAQADAMPANCPSWFNRLCAELLGLMADAELASPFDRAGIAVDAVPERNNCRVCGVMIADADRYCMSCALHHSPVSGFESTDLCDNDD